VSPRVPGEQRGEVREREKRGSAERRVQDLERRESRQRVRDREDSRRKEAEKRENVQ